MKKRPSKEFKTSIFSFNTWQHSFNNMLKQLNFGCGRSRTCDALARFIGFIMFACFVIGGWRLRSSIGTALGWWGCLGLPCNRLQPLATIWELVSLFLMHPCLRFWHLGSHDFLILHAILELLVTFGGCMIWSLFLYSVFTRKCLWYVQACCGCPEAQEILFL